MRLMMKMMLACLAVAGVSAQAEAAQYLYQYVPDLDCTNCVYQTPFSFTYDTNVGPNPDTVVGFADTYWGHPTVSNAFFTVDSPGNFNPDSGLTSNTLGIHVRGPEAEIFYEDGDMILEGYVGALFELASDGSIVPAYDENGNTASVVPVKDIYNYQPSGAFQVTEIAAVPEPATWAMMIVGFGLVGYVMRRRRISYAAAMVG